MVTLVSTVHDMNSYSAMLVTLDGIVILGRLEQFSKAACPRLLTLEGAVKVTEVRPEQ
jgi:hypothetical protein